MSHPNPVLNYILQFRPNLLDERDFERVAAVLQYMRFHHGEWTPETVTDALAELLPDQREFWLRVGATANIRLVEGMTYMFQDKDEPTP